MPKKSNGLYKISDVAKIVGVKAYVLRFWEKEFPQLSPKRTKTGQRIYTEEDIKLIKKIIHLLYHEKLSIEGARKRLDKKPSSHVLDTIKRELLEIKKLLKGD